MQVSISEQKDIVSLTNSNKYSEYWIRSLQGLLQEFLECQGEQMQKILEF